MNYELEFYITPDDIYNKLSPIDQEKIKHIKFIDATILNNNNVKISCMLSEEPIQSAEHLYLLSSIPDGSFSLD